MVAALLFLVGQLFLFGTTSAQCPVPCTPCKVFPDGDYKGTWYLKAEIDSRCFGSCLYQRNSDGEEMCFCDPGLTEYNTTCVGCGCTTGCETSNTWLAVTGGDNDLLAIYKGRLDSTEIISSTGVCQPSIAKLPVATSAGEMVFRTLGCKEGELIFCGGSPTFEDNTHPINKWGATNVCHSLDTATPTTWSTIPPMLEKRAWFSLTKINENEMIAVGGIDTSGAATATMEKYSGGSWTFLPIALPMKRFGHCTVPIKKGGSDYLIVIGGSDDVPSGDSWKAVDTVYEVNVDSPTSVIGLASLPERLFRPACTITCDGDIIVSGGAQGDGHSPPASTNVYKYTVDTDLWSAVVGHLNTKRWGHVMGKVGAYANKKISVAAGYTQTDFLASVEDSYNDGVTWTNRIKGLKVEREYAASAEVPASVFKCEG